MVRPCDGVVGPLTKGDALVANLQVLGKLSDVACTNTAAHEEKPDTED